jgi:hypothetical protein
MIVFQKLSVASLFLFLTFGFSNLGFSSASDRDDMGFEDKNSEEETDFLLLDSHNGNQTSTTESPIRRSPRSYDFQRDLSLYRQESRLERYSVLNSFSIVAASTFSFLALAILTFTNLEEISQ